MEDKLNGFPVVSPEYLQQWVQSAQQFQALQAQYSGFNHPSHYPEGQTGEAAMAHMSYPEPMMDQQEPENLAKPPAKKRGRSAQPKEPKAPKPPKVPKAPKPPKPPKVPKAPKPPKPPKVPKAPKPAKDPNAPKAKPGPKPKKAADAQGDGKQEKIDESFKKVKRKIDRFKGMSEEEVMTKTLPDLLEYNLDYVIIGINPGLMAAFIGRWFPGPGNHFWKCLFLSGFTEELLNHMHDTTLPGKYKMGFTNMVARATPGSKDLSSKELREGGKILVEKLKTFKPLIAVFNGKCIYEMFCREMFGKKPKKLDFGLQPHKIPDCEVALYLMPSSSARCAQFPRAQDKVHFYIKLRELRDQLKGVQKPTEVEEVDYSFDLSLAKEDAKRMAIKEEQYDPGYEDAFGGVYAEKGAEGAGGAEGSGAAAGPGGAEGSGAPSQTNGHCTFSSADNTEGAQEATTSQIPEGQLPDGQWMTQSFADQIPDISGAPKEASA
uniref:G/T mismatch-specific thymine DNA glycosylase-like isoform X1 n=2 Tax=Gasterosteus aculeatus aculeatus TaxID=481459 RepID=UPI001A99AE31|nr:G/T mismatch-specific thymine DNA glycosylase-like isoform X1 [Gasterosteus aculeatus aculeatus]